MYCTVSDGFSVTRVPAQRLLAVGEGGGGEHVRAERLAGSAMVTGTSRTCAKPSLATRRPVLALMNTETGLSLRASSASAAASASLDGRHRRPHASRPRARPCVPFRERRRRRRPAWPWRPARRLRAWRQRRRRRRRASSSLRRPPRPTASRDPPQRAWSRRSSTILAVRSVKRSAAASAALTALRASSTRRPSSLRSLRIDLLGVLHGSRRRLA